MMFSDDKEAWIWFFQCRLKGPFSAPELRAAREALMDACLRHGLKEEQAWDLSAAADELMCNVLEHNQAGWMDLGICQEANTGMLRLRLLDDGERFDVAVAAERSEEAAGDGNDRRLGLHLVKGVSKQLVYRRLEEGANELVLSLG